MAAAGRVVGGAWRKKGFVVAGGFPDERADAGADRRRLLDDVVQGALVCRSIRRPSSRTVGSASPGLRNWLFQFSGEPVSLQGQADDVEPHAA